MEKKENKSPHGWFIIVLIILTLTVFLFVMVSSSPNTKQTITVHKAHKETNVQLVMPTSPPVAIKITRNKKVLYKNDKREIVQEAITRYLNSLPDTIQISKESYEEETRAYSTKSLSLSLHGYEISEFSVGKNFLVYDCTIVPTTDHLTVTILMELPPWEITFKDHPEYSQFCPSINPYIHAVELVYQWGYDNTSMDLYNNMRLSNLKIRMVPWENNLYNKSYEQVKNSPLYKSPVPMPLNLQKGDLYDFLIKSEVFATIPMIFNPPLKLEPVHEQITPLPTM